MTLMERARKFMGAKARTLALTVAPLASLVMVAPQAKAVSTSALNFYSGSCFISQQINGSVSGGSCSAAVNPDAGNGANGAKLFGDAQLTTFGGLSGGSTIGFNLSGFTDSGLFSGNLPVSWDFHALASDSSPVYWDLKFMLNVSGGATISPLHESGCLGSGCSTPIAAIGTNPFDYHVMGSDAFNIPADTSILDYSIELTLSQSAPDGSTLELQVPGNSVDINGASAPTPEPASMTLGGIGLGAIALSRLRRKRS